MIAQNVGINTNTPNASAMLHIETGGNVVKGLLVTGVYNFNATVPDLGAPHWRKCSEGSLVPI